MTCKHCGATVEAFDQFCSVCGKSLAVEPEVTSPTAPEAVSQADAAEDSFPASKRPVKLYPPENGSGSAAGTQIPTAIYLSESVQSVAAATDAVLESAAAAAAPEASAQQQERSQPVDAPDTRVYEPHHISHPAARKKAERRRKLGRALLVVLVAAACVATIAAVYVTIRTSTLRGQMRKVNAEKAACEQTIAELETELADLQQQLTDANEENTTLNEQLTDLQDQLDTANTNLNQYIYDRDAAQRDLETVKTELSTVRETLTDLETQLAQAQEDYKTLQDSQTTLQSDYDALKTENDANKQTLSFFNEHVVFVTDTKAGSYYHRYGCSDFSVESSFYAYNIKLAESNGFKPCTKCCADLVATSGTDPDVITPSPSASPTPSQSPTQSGSTSSIFNWFQ